MNLASRLNRLEKRLGPPEQASPNVIILALALTKEELELIERALMRGDRLEDIPGIEDMQRKIVAVTEELNRKNMPQKLAGELDAVVSD